MALTRKERFYAEIFPSCEIDKARDLNFLSYRRRYELDMLGGKRY